MTISTFLGFGSYTLGFNQKLSAHFRFARTLEDPAGFNRALRNINARLGGPEHFPYGVPERQELMGFAFGPVTAISKVHSANGETPETTEPGGDWAASPVQDEPDQSQGKSHYVIAAIFISRRRRLRMLRVPNSSPQFDPLYSALPEHTRSHYAWLLARQTSQPSVPIPPGKWDEIRAANNKGGSASSWDLIRQNHERNQIVSPSSSQSPNHSQNLTGGANGTNGSYNDSPDLDSTIAIDKNDKQWDNRAFDEAQFNAVLEAERRRASQSDPSASRAERSPPQ